MSDEERHRSISMREAAMIQFGSRYASIVVQIFITSVLARMLTPSDYGVVAITQVFTGFFTMLSDIGISTAVVQYQDLDEDDLGALMSFTIVLGIILLTLFCIAAYPISMIYDNDLQVLYQCWATSPAVLLGCLNMVPSGYLLKERRFPEIGARLLVASVISGLLAIASALAGFGSYSLAIQAVSQIAVELFWNINGHSQLLRHLIFDFRNVLHRVFRYTAFQFGFNFINYFSRNLDNILLGRYLGKTALAYYDKAYKLTTYPMTAVSSVIGTIIQPYMTEHKDYPEKIFDVWMHIEKLISLVAAPVTAICICCSEEIVMILFGNQWGESVPIFRALAFSVYFQMMNNPSGGFYQSLGKTDLMFQSGMITTGVTFVAIVEGIYLGNTLWVARLVSIAYCANGFIVAIQLVYRAFGQSLLYLSTFLPEVLTAIIVCIIYSRLNLNIDMGYIESMIGKIIVVFTIFLVSYCITGQTRHFYGD